jgi:N-methylhydantoinase B
MLTGEDEMTRRFAPYELEILWNRLLAIAEEQAQVLMRTAFSTIVREAGDLSAAIFDRRGRMIAQAQTGTPGHINTMALGMRHFLDAYPAEGLSPGDALLSNDPYRLSGQLNDMSVVTPVFHDRRVVAFFASCCHMVDVGGIGLTADGREVFEEGLHVPFCKLRISGVANRDVTAFIAANVRTPREVLGDLHAQLSAGDVGAARLIELLQEFRLEDVDDLAEEIISRSEQAVRNAISTFPSGRFGHVAMNDGFEQPLRIAAELRREGDELLVDFAGTDSAIDRGINVPLAYTTAYSTYAVKCVLAPEVPNNHGSFVPIHVDAPVGSLLNPVSPAPTAARHIVGHYLPSVIFPALAKALPGRVPADSAAGLWVTQITGRTDAGDPFAFAFFSVGGMGARPDSDGLSTTSFPSGVRSVATEVMESVAPLLFHSRELRPDSGGPGRYRGGLGQTIEFEVRSQRPAVLSAMYDRLRDAPRGADGGHDGAGGAVTGQDGRPLASKGRTTLQPGEAVRLDLPGGGGYGPPGERARSAVLADIEAELVSPEAAETTYGIAPAPKAGIGANEPPTPAGAAGRSALPIVSGLDQSVRKDEVDQSSDRSLS